MSGPRRSAHKIPYALLAITGVFEVFLFGRCWWFLQRADLLDVSQARRTLWLALPLLGAVLSSVLKVTRRGADDPMRFAPAQANRA